MNHKLLGGWALPFWKIWEFVSWDDYSIPNFSWQVIINPFHGSSQHQPDQCSLQDLSEYPKVDGVKIPTGEDGPPDTKKIRPAVAPIFYGLPVCVYM